MTLLSSPAPGGASRNLGVISADAVAAAAARGNHGLFIPNLLSPALLPPM
ncbi:MAG: hypothetical protein ACREFJ_03485 [Acetobacteraceae bacterium]